MKISNKNEKLDYIIIGSGIAGIHTAYRLQQKGKKVLVLEKESYVGGRMSSILINGRYVDFGAKFIGSVYKNMLPLARELDVNPVPIPLNKVGILKNNKLYTIGDSKLSALLYKGISLKARLQLGTAVFLRLIKYPHLDLYKLENNLKLDDKSIYDDFRNFAGVEGYDHVLESFSRNVIFTGTKDFSRGAFYSILFKFLRLKPFTFPEGIGQLCKKMATSLPVEFGVKVKSVQRTFEGITVSIQNGGTTYLAKNVVVAIPGNRVLDILENPSPYEKEFFSQIPYASTVQIYCEGNTNIFNQTNGIWTLPHENSNFTALGKGAAKINAEGFINFTVALREKTYKYLLETNNFNPNYLKGLIEKEFPNISDLKIIRVQVWDSATPIFYPGYLTKLSKFLNRTDWNNGIYFCGDYLENPSTEGALTSSIELLQKLNFE